MGGVGHSDLLPALGSSENRGTETRSEFSIFLFEGLLVLMRSRSGFFHRLRFQHAQQIQPVSERNAVLLFEDQLFRECCAPWRLLLRSPEMAEPFLRYAIDDGADALILKGFQLIDKTVSIQS